MQTRANASLLLVLLLGLIAAHPVFAQDTRVLRIQNGRISINDKALTTASVPKTLDLDDMDLRLELPATPDPVIALGDGIYVIESDKIRDASPEEIEEHGILAVLSLSDDDARNVVFTSLRNIEENVANASSEQVRAAVRGNAVRASQMVAALPHLEMQSYWNGVRENDDALYQALVREARIEREVAELVQTIRVLPPGKPRDQSIENLRDQLFKLFDMKQENRQQEIVELSEQLETLKVRMEQREKMRDEIVDQRLKELLRSNQ